MKNLLFIIFLMIFYCCNPDKATRIASDKAKFNTSDASEIFFKNVRQTYYEKNEIEAAKIDFYKNKKLLEEEVLLFPQIVHNWREDQAYILLEFDPGIAAQNQLKLISKDSIGQIDEKVYPLVDKKVHFEIVSDIYNHILDDHKIFLIIQQDSISLFPNQAAREAFRITMVDFYRLVDMY